MFFLARRAWFQFPPQAWTAALKCSIAVKMSVAQKYYLYTDSASHHLFDNFNFSVYIILGNRTKI